MKRLLAWVLAVLMIVGVTVVLLVQVAAETGTTEKLSPTTLKNFLTTNGFAVGGDHTAGRIVDEGGYIKLYPANDPIWYTDEEGVVVSAYANVDVAWYLRKNADAYTDNKLSLTQDLMYIAIKVKQTSNFMENARLECWFGVPLNPENPHDISEFPLYSNIIVHRRSGYDYLVFDVANSGYTTEWIGHTLSTLKFTWAICEVNEDTRANTTMDVYEICFLGTTEDVEAYVGTSIAWPEIETVPETVSETEVETETVCDTQKEMEIETNSWVGTVAGPNTTDGDEQTTVAPSAATSKTDEAIPGFGCKSVIATASILSAVTLAAGVVVCKKKD